MCVLGFLHKTHSESVTSHLNKLLHLKDELNGGVHVLHDLLWLHQRRVKAEIAVSVEDGLFDTLAGIFGQLHVRVVDARAHKDGLAGGGRGRRELAFPAAIQLQLLRDAGGRPCSGHHVCQRFGALPGHPILEVAVVEVGTINISHQVVPNYIEKISQLISFIQTSSKCILLLL